MSSRVFCLCVCLGLGACGSAAKPAPDRPAPSAPASAPAAAAAAAAAPALDPPQPTLRLPRNFVPTGYRARLAIDPAKDGFAGAIEIDGEVRERSKGLWLHGRQLKVSAAKVTPHGGHAISVEVAAAGDDLLSLHPAEPLDPGPVTIALDYTGAFDLVQGTGAYKKTVDDAPYVETQFESISARRVFPCLDEPDNKVSWQLLLDVPKGLVAVANTSQTGETALDATTKRVAFAPTKPLPSYLIAFGVGPYEIVDAGKTRAGTPIRIIALKGKARDTKWAAETSARIVELLEDYFGIPYPYDKLDHIARPTLMGGAMENAGLITYGSRLILRDPARITPGEKLAWVSVAAHELAHQWFGDLVTTAWWDDIWLNEGFATWLAAKIVTQFDPAWHGELLSVEERGIALGADNLVTARRIRQPIASTGDIFQAFDGITYNKGASVLAMFEHAIGPEKFRDGVRAYLKKHAFGNATSADFVAAISEVAGHDVAPAFSSFLDQAGVPVVRVELRCDAGQPPTLALSQHRYVRPGSPTPPEGKPWQLPVCVAYDRGGARGETCTELTSANAELALDAKACPAWVFANAGARGYYHSSQTDAALIALRDHGWKQLTPAERVVAYNDIAAFGQTGEADIAIAMSLVPRMLAEHHRVATASAASATAVRSWISPANQPRFEAWVRATFGPAARALSWQARPHDDIDAERARAVLVPTVAFAGDAALRASAVALARNWRTMPSSNRSSLLAVAVDADRATFDRVLATAPAETDPELRTDALRALTMVSSEAHLRSVIALTFDKRIEQGEARILVFAGRTPAGQRVVADYFRQHLDELLARFPENGNRGAAGFANLFTRTCDAAMRDDTAAFIKDRFGKMIGAQRVITNGLEQLDQCIATQRMIGPKLDAWLARAAR